MKKLRTIVRNFITSRNPVLFEDDVFLVSYPKSGNTWMRFLLANYIAGEKVDISQTNLIIPDVHYNPHDITKTLNPRIIKSHEPFSAKYKRVVYIVRDGRDVAVSYFFHLKKFHMLPVAMKFSEYLDAFIDGKFHRSVPWDKHIYDWLDGAKEHILIRYEDMLSNTANELGRVIQFCNLKYDEKKISTSVAASTLIELRQIEVKQFHEIKILSTSDPDIHFFRKGCRGDWKKYFSENDEKKFREAFSKIMNRIGYG